MSDISPLSNSSFSALSNNSTGTQQEGIGQEFNNFLQLLTAQIQNQDPLAPLDSTQFVEQLATFSSLEQQVETNTSLDRISDLIANLNAIAADQWLGEQVTIESSWVPYLGETVEYEIQPPNQADSGVLTVRDSNGTVVWSEGLDLSSVRQSWDGQLGTGETAAIDSLYQVSIDYYGSGEFLGSTAPRLVTTVTDVATENGKLKLGTAMKLTADAEDVRTVK